MQDKKLGIIGGMGPLATAVFLEKVIEFTKAEIDADHIFVEVINDPSIPDRTDYLLGKGNENPAARINEIRKELEDRGCEVIAIPCNTAFGLYDEFAGDGKSTIIHSIEETASYLKEYGIQKAGILATDGTIRTGLFQNALREKGISALIPEDMDQKLVMDMIYAEVKKGRRISADKMMQVSGHLKEKGAEVILLGCTELAMGKRDGIIGEGYLDTMDVVARRAVLLCGKQLKDVGRLF